MPDLIAPTPHLHTAWLEAHAEWGPGLHEDGFGLLPTDDVDSMAGFAAWIARLASAPCTFRWIVEDDRVLGGVLESIADTKLGPARRYWITIDAA